MSEDDKNPEEFDATEGNADVRPIPVEPACVELIGSMKSKVLVKDDIFSTGIKWDACAARHRLKPVPPSCRKV